MFSIFNDPAKPDKTPRFSAILTKFFKVLISKKSINEPESFFAVSNIMPENCEQSKSFIKLIFKP
tara:strand:+ start:761 stop:955 length:195 start_codon:yes stop_codon:yes gene_type:complete